MTFRLDPPAPVGNRGSPTRVSLPPISLRVGRCATSRQNLGVAPHRTPCVVVEGDRNIESSTETVNREDLVELMANMEHLACRPLGARVHALRTKTVVQASQEVSILPLKNGAPPSMAAGIATWRLAKPRADDFFVTDQVWEQLCFVLSRGKNVLSTGPSGCGKSELCYRVAEAAGRSIEPFNCGAMSEPRSSLIGNTHFDRQNGTWFAESRFVRAVQKTGACILLDEISRAGRDAFNILLPVLDTQGYLAIDEAE
jgi:AAA domain (dynein-related subfamily)